MIRFLVGFLYIIALAGCSSVQPIPAGKVVHDYGAGCKVTVYQTMQEAYAEGPVEQLCVITGTSSGSFTHTPEVAIKKHAEKACECGADKVYVQSRVPGGWSVASVTMIAFKSGTPLQPVVAASTPVTVEIHNATSYNSTESLKLAESECQKRGKHAVLIPDFQRDGIATYECKN